MIAMYVPSPPSDITHVPARPRTVLRRVLSHHEIATLLLLLHAPISSANSKPELPALHKAGLVEMVQSGREDAPLFQLSADGSAVLAGLGLN